MSRARTLLALTFALVSSTLVVPSWASATTLDTVSVDGFERATPGLSTTTGSASTAITADRSEGAGALAISYDVSGSLAELAYDPMAAPTIPAPVSALMVDLKGDGSYNTVYLRVRDSTGEALVYPIDAMRATTWQTLTVDLTAEPVSHDGGNGDGVLDAPLTVAGVVVVRNGEQPPTGTFVLDNVRAVPTGWSLPVAASAYVAPQSGESAEISINAGGPGDWELRLADSHGLARTLSGEAAASGRIAVAWNGRDDQGKAMAGDVHAVLRQDSVADGSLRGATTTGVPLLLTLADADDPGVTTSVESFDAGADGWEVATGKASLQRGSALKSHKPFRTEGNDALAVDYDLSGGMAGIVRTAALDLATTPMTGLKVDLKGDGSFNTLYLRLTDATGEAFTYRIDAMRQTTWTTIPIDLTQDPVLAEGGQRRLRARYAADADRLLRRAQRRAARDRFLPPRQSASRH